MGLNNKKQFAHLTIRNDQHPHKKTTIDSSLHSESLFRDFFDSEQSVRNLNGNTILHDFKIDFGYYRDPSFVPKTSFV